MNAADQPRWLAHPHSAARHYLRCGLSVFPVRADGSKAPRLRGWRQAAEALPPAEALDHWFDVGAPTAVGVAGGRASGNLVFLDFEGREPDVWDRWLDLVMDAGEVAPLARCPVVRTPSGGRHVYVRLPDVVPGAKLAQTEDRHCLIETRGHQHFVVAPGSHPAAHATGRPYLFEQLGWLDEGEAPVVDFTTWLAWTTAAAKLTRYERPTRVVGERRPDTPGAADGDRPGDDFNRRVQWADILESRGWRVCGRAGKTIYWTRPGKPDGVSASTGFCHGENSGDLLYVWSTSTVLPAGEAFSKFGALAFLDFNGDFTRAAHALAAKGFGRDRRPATAGVAS